jgi:feruloyl-CoA synthase
VGVTLVRLAPRGVIVRRSGEAWLLDSPIALAPPPATLCQLVRRAAERAPSRDFLLERDGDAIRRVTWCEALAAAEGVASWLVRENPTRRAIVALSGASIDHALLMLGCFFAGVPFVPVSPSYSLLSQDFAKLRRIAEKVRPAFVYTETRGPFERALAAIGDPAVRSICGGPSADPDALYVRELFATSLAPELAARESAIAPDDTAKILFTSGSTAFPKGVPNTHRMLTSNQQMIAQLWPFLGDEPLVLVDWLPWSHTFGGNHNFNMVLFHAGTLFIDHGKPTDAAIALTIRNVRELPPTIYFNVPAGYAALVPRLEADADLRRIFFSRLRVMFYAAAALPDELWQRLRALAARSTDREVFLTTAWGSTETSPLATSAHFPLERAGNIGLPAPGVTLKLVPDRGKLAVLVRGPSVMRGYLDEPELTRAAFDDDGFYRIGDAVRFADPDDPSRGLVFDGRVAEDFKLTTGTWVNVGTLRTQLLTQLAPALLDLVIAGHDRESIAVMGWPSTGGCRALVGGELDPTTLARSPAVRAHVAAALARWNVAHPESSMRIARAILLAEPPSLDAGEITDKGYVNQRATLERRRTVVAALYAETPGAEVIVV